MDAGKRKELIDQYNDGYRVVAEALAGATDEELDAHPAPGKWSAREVVHHLADSEMTSAIAAAAAASATDNPQIFGYDQDEFARRLYYDRPIEASLDAFKTARRSTGEILERMTDADWARAAGTHTEHGALHRGAVARDLRRARARARRADPGRARRRAQNAGR